MNVVLIASLHSYLSSSNNYCDYETLGFQYFNLNCITVFDVVQFPSLSCPPVSLTKFWLLATSLKKIYIDNFSIRNYFKKDLLNFSFH